MCRRRGLKINADKSKVMVMNGEEGLEWEAHLDGFILSMYPNSYFLDVFWTN